MAYRDLIPTVFPLSIASLANNTTYRSKGFNVGDRMALGVVVKAGATLKVAIAYGGLSDSADVEGTSGSGTLPYQTAWQSFASNSSATEGGTYYELAVPPEARRAQLLIRNESGGTVSGITVDAALRVVAFPASSIGGSGDFASITGWPGSSSQVVRGDGSYSPLGASDIPSGVDAAKIGGGAVSNTEYSYLDGVTSAIQNQLNARLPLAGGSLTGALKMSGTHTALGSTETGFHRDSSGQINYNVPSGVYHNFLCAGTQYGAIGPGGLVLSQTQSSPGAGYTALWRDSAGGFGFNTPTGSGINGYCNGAGFFSANAAYGIQLYGSQALLGSSIVNIYRDSSGNLNSNVTTGATHIARVNGTRVGGFPLQYADMPAKELFVAQVTTGQTISTSLAQLTLQAATTNDGAFSVASSNLTCLIAGWYLFDCRLIGSNATAAWLELDINGARIAPGASNPANATFVYTCPIKLFVGDVVKLKAQCLGTSLTIDTATYAFLRNLTVLRIN